MKNTHFIRKAGIRTKISLLFYLVTGVSLAVVGWFGYQNASDAYRGKALELVSGYTEDAVKEMEAFLRKVPDDLNYVAGYYALKHYLYWDDLGVDAKSAHWKSVATDNFRSFMESRSAYYKIRFLDRDGREGIHVRYDRERGRVQVMDASKLEEQGKEPYFTGPLAMGKGGLFVSTLDLNRDKGRIRKPHLPLIRFATPVVGDNSVRYGVAVIDVYADAFIESLSRVLRQEGKGWEFFLLSDKGDYYFAPEREKEWGHLLGHPANFHNDYPNLFGQMEGKESGILESGGRIVSFFRVYPNPGDRENFWYLVGKVDEGQALAQLSDFIYIFAVIFFTVAVLVFFIVRVATGGMLAPLAAATRQLDRLGRGEILKEEIHYRSEDEIYGMLRTLARLTRNMERLARQADAIAAGDYSRRVPILSEQDLLGNAINNMTKILRQTKEEDLKQNWLKDGIAALSQELSGDLGPQTLAEKAVGYIGRYTESGHGVFYLFDETKEKPLELLGSYMFIERDRLEANLEIGEGAVGQAAREKKPILLKGLEHQGPQIITGTVVATPLDTYTFPLIYEGVLYGVVELASSQPFDEDRRIFLEEAAGVIAAGLYSVLQKERIRGLLEESEAATRQAQEQSKQLQIANTQMEEQQQQLQQQTEELQQTNAQMEEQQQQLRQQTAEMEQKNRELGRSREELDQRARMLEQANRYKSEFLANMSHELRTPLNSIILLSKMMKMNEAGNLTDDDIKRAEVVNNAGNELLRLINDILDLSKIEAGKMDVTVEEVASSVLLREYEDLFEATALDKGLEFIVEDKWNKPLTTDRHKLSQVVRNLLSNAFKFTREGSVSLSIEPGGPGHLPVKIVVKDTGIGIPEEKQEMVFEAFQQVDGSITRQFGGTGLGLSITRKFLEVLGGEVELESKEGEGSTFTLYLPEAIAAAGEEATAPAPRPELVPASAPAGRALFAENDDRKRLEPGDTVILVVDDDPAFTHSVAQLNRNLGYKTLIAGTGKEALELARAHRLGGILLDLGLPDMGGTEVLETLKSDPVLRPIPVYIVSARDRDETLMAKGAEGFLQKPVDPEQIRQAEETILARVGESVRSILVIEGKAVDGDAIREAVSDKEIQVDGASGMDEALSKMEGNRYDLLVVDYIAAGGKGSDACERLREKGGVLPLIVFSGRSLSTEEEAALRKYTDSIIVRSAKASERLSRDIHRFLTSIPGTVEGHTPVTDKAPAPGEGLKGKKILVVDDDARNLFVLTSALEQQGAVVETALNGKKGLERLEEMRPDLILMDIMMPEMDGYEAIKAIRADKRLASIPVIALTAKALKEDKERCIRAGADDYLSKPVDYEVLVNMAVLWSGKER